ncbi:MAG: radical SAM protein [Herminiimonas sp.]|nr:radical SAM protein [Herminiimonas sp.]
MDNTTPGSSTGLKYWSHLLAEPDNALQKLLTCAPDMSHAEKLSLFRRNVAIINIETSSACNRFCSYCPDATYDRKTQILMDPALWQRFVQNIEAIRYEQQISLNLYNEPMLDPTLNEKIADLKRASPKCITKFSSNGDYLNPQTLDQLELAGLDQIYVTLHAPPGKPYRDPQQLEAFAKFFRRIKLALPELDHEPGVKIHTQLQWGGIKLVVMSNNWAERGNDRAGTVISLKKRIARTAPCMRVFREFTISHLGEVFPCCQFFPDAPDSKQHVLGHVGQSDMVEIYSSPSATNWRKSMLTFSAKARPCDTCSDPDNALPETSVRRLALSGKV